MMNQAKDLSWWFKEDPKLILFLKQIFSAYLLPVLLLFLHCELNSFGCIFKYLILYSLIIGLLRMHTQRRIYIYIYIYACMYIHCK